MACSFTVNREHFEQALFGIQNIAQRRSAAAILANVRIDAATGILTLYATDYDVALTRQLEADVHLAGSATLPARILYEIVKKSNADTVDLEVGDNHQAVLKTGSRSRYKLVGMDPEDFPEPHRVAGEPRLTLDRKMFQLWVRKTLFAAAPDESRAALNGVFLEANGHDAMRMVATDTHRLALVEATGVPAATVLGSEGVILPRKALAELMKILDGEGDIAFSLEPPYVRIAWDQTVFILRTVEGRFPSYRTVIPEEATRIAYVDRKAMQDAIERVSLVVTDRFKSVTLRFSDNQVTLLARNPEMGEGEEQIDAEYTHESLDIGFNAVYLSEALSEITTDRVEIHLIDDVSPTLIHGEGDRSYLNVIMPMRI